MLNWFRKKHRDEPADSDDKDGLSSPLQIAGLLQKICAHHCLLKIAIDGRDEVYSSIILDVQKDQYLRLDEFSPAPRRTVLTPGTVVEITTILEGLDVSFHSTISPANAGDDTSVWITLPSKVCYAQYRNENRVIVPMNWRTSVTIWLDARTSIDGKVRDLSPSGFCALLAETPHLEATPSPLRFAVTLGDERIEGEIEIRYVAETIRGRQQQIGTHILAIAPHHQRILDQSVADIDRQQQRLR